MPNLDRTGPQGLGPMTGRRLGRCVTKSSNEVQNAQAVSRESAERDVYGIGRGGRPWGGGNGNCYGGGNGTQGMGRRRRFGR